MVEDERMVVRFTKPVSPYNEGEIAGFFPQRAAELIERGLAVEWDGKPIPPPTTTEEHIPEQSGEPLDGNVAQVTKNLAGIDDIDVLKGLAETEDAAEKPRKGVLKAIQARLDELAPDETPSGETPSDSGGDDDGE